MTMAAFFYYHSGQGAIGFLNPNTRKPDFCSIAAIRNAGWTVEEGFVRSVLPRADTTHLLFPDPSMKGVIGHVGSVMGPLTGGRPRQR